jgi:putative peptide zinc metalloprotease protein
MSTVADSMASSTGRKLPLRMRPDLVLRRHVYQGQNCWAIKEPLAPSYFRFHEEDFAVLEMLDGQSSLDDIRERFTQRYPHRELSAEHLWEFIGTLHRGNLVISGVPNQGEPLEKRRSERRRKELLSQLANVLALRFRGFDPERLFGWLYPKVRRFFSPLALACVLALGLSALLLVVVQFDVFYARLPAFHQFFGLKNAGSLILALVISKILHEFGHGLTCKHFGGECHEIGVLMLVFTPCLYCNVSDSWMLPSKWQRMAIGAAGMYVELVLASICTFVWWFSEPGFLNYLCLYIIFVCSVSTVLFNANPLLRYDGYYILSDWLEIPNLRQKSGAALQRTAAWWCLGLEPLSDRYLPPRGRGGFLLYGVASGVYRWLVLAAILWFLLRVLQPYHLEIIGQLVAGVALGGLVVMPAWKIGKFFYVPGRWDEVKKPRLVISLGVLAVLVAAVTLVPLPHRVICPLEIKAHGAVPVYVEVAGNLRKLHVRRGSQVQAGDQLAELESVDLELEIAQLRSQRDQQAIQLGTLKRQRFLDAQALGEVPQIEERLASTEKQLSKRLADRERLVILAPVAGSILPPPHVEEKEPHDGKLRGWVGTPLEETNVGCRLDTKTLLCQVGDPQQLEAVLVIDQSDLEFVRTGDRVELKLDELPGQTLTGTIAGISQMEMRATPSGLSVKAGGELATKTDESGVERPQSTSYQAQVLLEDEEGLLRLGLRGRAKIHTGSRTLAQRAWRYFSHTFRFGK